MLLNQRADIWRLVADKAKAGRTVYAAWRKGVACHLEPISAIDHTVPFALESTHVFYLPTWFAGLRKDDEIRFGGRVDGQGKRLQNRYTVVGIRRFPTFGERHQAAYCKELE